MYNQIKYIILIGFIHNVDVNYVNGRQVIKYDLTALNKPYKTIRCIMWHSKFIPDNNTIYKISKF